MPHAQKSYKEKKAMSTPIVGLHHVTAIASDPQRNLDFYTDVLGLRFVKRTINFDDPGTYHFYFGDDIGKPGTILTFFPWPGAMPGRTGTGQVVATAFSIPSGSHAFWISRLQAKGVPFTEHRRFDAAVLAFHDPDGMTIELIEHARSASRSRASLLRRTRRIRRPRLFRSDASAEPLGEILGLARRHGYEANRAGRQPYSFCCRW